MYSRSLLVPQSLSLGFVLTLEMHCIIRTCSDFTWSVCGWCSSTSIKIRSNLESKLVIIEVFSWRSALGFHFYPKTGFVAAIIVVLVLILHTFPALATLIVCCSIASWMLALSPCFNKENSSIVQTPQSAKTRAPASKIYSLPSLNAETVRPADVVPMPVVITDRLESWVAHYKNWLLPVPGSPTISMWI